MICKPLHAHLRGTSANPGGSNGDENPSVAMQSFTKKGEHFSEYIHVNKQNICYGNNITLRCRLEYNRNVKKKSTLHCSGGITSKRATSGEVHLRGLAPGQYSSEKNMAAAATDLTGLRIEPKTSPADSDHDPLNVPASLLSISRTCITNHTTHLLL